MLTGVNHITLAVTDLNRSIGFYRDVLGAHMRAKWATGAYLELGSLWLSLAREGHVAPRADDTHIAFSADDFAVMAQKISAVAPVWKENVSEGASLYFLDPDGHKLELHDGSLESRLAHYAAQDDGKVTIY